MELDTVIKLSYIISVNDIRKNLMNLADKMLILTEDRCIPSAWIDNFEDSAHLETLKKLNNDYLKYDFEYVKPILGDFRIKDGIPEVTYVANVIYNPGLNKRGRLMSISEINNNNILIEDYYGKIFVKFGGKVAF